MAGKIPSPKKLPYGIPSILDQQRPYNHHTDVTETWKKYGWVPPQEQKDSKHKEY